MKKLVSMMMALAMLVGLGFSASASESSDLEFLTITVSMYELTDFGGDAVGDAIEKKFNVDIVPMLQDWDISVIRLMASSDSLPDAFATSTVGNGSLLWDFIDQGLIREVPEDMLKQYDSSYEKVMSNTIQQMVLDLSGGIYFLPRPESANNLWTAQPTFLAVRADWMENLGIAEDPEDMDALYELLRAFTFDDPDGNGAADTYGLTGSYNMLYQAFNAYPDYWVALDGGYLPGYLDPSMLDALKWLRGIYQEGILDPELGSDADKFAQGTFGAFARQYDAWWVNRVVKEIFGGANPDLDPLQAIAFIGPFSATADAEKYATPKVQTSGTEFRAGLSDEELERLIMIDNYLIQGEGNDLRYWGIRGVDYDIDAQGNYTKLNSDVLRTKYPSIYIQNWPTWDWEWNADMSNAGNPDIAPEVKQMSADAAAKYNAAYNADTSKISVAATYLWTDSRGDYMFDYGARLVEIITGADDVQTMFDQFVADAYDAGVQQVIDECNQVLG